MGGERGEEEPEEWEEGLRDGCLGLVEDLQWATNLVHHIPMPVLGQL